MKLFKFLFLAFLSISITAAHAQSTPWKEKKAFHEVMAGTFHPSEEGNLKPLKEKAGELVKRAKAWQQSKAPEGVNQAEASKILDRLVAKCEEIKKAVDSKASDNDLKKMISEAHDIFHELAEKCRPGKHEH